MNKFYRVFILVFSAWYAPLAAQEATGVVVFDVKPFTSEIDLKEKILTQLESGGLEWGAGDGQLVISLLNKRFVGFDLPYFTRYGNSETLELPAGTYRVSCVGFTPEGGLNVEKVLSKGAYFNLDVLTLEVRAGETTTIRIEPTIRKESTFFVKFFLPELLATVVDQGAAVVINERTDASIAWDDYDGPLKFTAE